MLLNAVGVMCIGLLCALTGMVLFAFYADQGCDPLADGKVTSPNQVGQEDIVYPCAQTNYKY